MVIRRDLLMTVLLALLLLATQTGCPLAILAEDFTVYAAHKPANVRTLVLVDDARGTGFGIPSAPNVIASRIIHDLREQKVITDFVPIADLNALAAREVTAFDALSTHEIATRLAAKQVIHVYIQDVQAQASGTMAKPTARVLVKVLDIENAQRVFPGPDDDAEAFPLEVTLFYRHTGPYNLEAANALGRQLADHVGRDVARLFFNYKRRTVGDDFED